MRKKITFNLADGSKYSSALKQLFGTDPMAEAIIGQNNDQTDAQKPDNSEREAPEADPN